MRTFLMIDFSRDRNRFLKEERERRVEIYSGKS